MATTTKVLYRAAATTSGTAAILYSVPTSGTTTVVTNIAVCNPLASTSTYTLNIGGVGFAVTSAVTPNSTVLIDLKQVIPYNGSTTSQMQITASAVTTAVTFHISGIEIS